jgi:hypothetical protein
MINAVPNLMMTYLYVTRDYIDLFIVAKNIQGEIPGIFSIQQHFTLFEQSVFIF